jgi:hypothetical protein
VGPASPQVPPFAGWQAEAGNSTTRSTFSPDLVVAADGTLYAYDRIRGVVALEPTKGHTKWATPIDVALTVEHFNETDVSLAIGADGTVYAWDGWLTALAPDGSISWSTAVTTSPATDGMAVLELTVGPDGTIYVLDGPQGDASTGGGVVAMNPDGTVKWRVDLGALTQLFSPAVGVGGIVYLVAAGADASTSVVAVTPEGSIAWVAENGASSGPHYSDVAPVIGDDGTLYVGCALGVCTYDPATGAPLGNVAQSSTMDILSVFPPTGSVYVQTDDFIAPLAVDPAWKLVGLAGGNLIIDGHGTLYTAAGGNWSTIALDPSGATVWEYEEGVPTAIGADGTIYCMSNQSPGTLNAIFP